MSHFTKRLPGFLVITFIALVLTAVAYAQSSDGQKEVSLGLPQQIGNFYQWALGIGGLIALGVLIFGGILYTISAGNASRQDDARQWITGSIVGLIILFGSWFILNTINPDLLKLKNLDLSQVQVEAAKAPQAARNLNLPQLVGNFYQWALGISGLLALGILVYAGLAYTAAGGNPSRQDDAKQWIWNALVGLGLLFSSYLILNTINPNLTKFQNLDLSQVKVEKVAEAPQAAENLNLPELIGNFYQWALGIGGLVALGILIFAGILYTISPGNSSRQGDAKTWIMSALLGLVLLFGSYAILNTVNPDLTKLRFNLSNVNLTQSVGGVAVPLEPPKPGEKVSLGIAQQIGNFYQWALGIGGLLALGVLIFGGILYTISAGNASRQDDAKSWLFGAVMGILLLFGSYLILNTINPELTKLKNLELIVNEAAKFNPQEPRIDTPPFSGPDCGGAYIVGSKTANKGNFGDPGCEAQAGANPQYRQALASLLQAQDPANALHWYKTVIPCETRPDGEYNPNAFNPNSPDPRGAWGLFQMGSTGRANGKYDFGNKPWQEQVSNAANLLKENTSRYWACW